MNASSLSIRGHSVRIQVYINLELKVESGGKTDLTTREKEKKD